MLSNITKKYLKTSENRRLLENFISLSIVQGLNYLLPLISFPYLVRVLGVEKFGLLSFSTSVIAYFQILTDYGFNLSATRDISIHRDNRQRVTEIFNAVLIIKLLLMMCGLLLLTILIVSFQRLRQDWIVYYITFGIVVGQVLFPVWFFQGIERMKYITILNMLAKIIFTIAIFVFVKNEQDYWKVPLFNSLGSIVAGLLSLWFIKNTFNILFEIPTKEVFVYQLKEGWHIFVSTVAISLYTIFTPFFLGLCAGNVFVGYYSAADRIIQAIKGLMGPLSQSIYPYIAKRVHDSKESGLKFIRKIVLLVGTGTGLISLMTLIFSKEIVYIVLGKNYSDSIIVLQLLSALPFLIGLSNIFGIQTMLTFNRKRAFQNILICASLLNIIVSIIFVPVYKHIGSAISVTIVELFVTVVMFIYLQKTNIKIIEC